MSQMTILKIVAVGVPATVAVLAVLLAFGSLRWRAGRRELRARIEAGRMRTGPEVVDFRELDGLPAVVQRYFRTVLEDGQPVVAAARVRHNGSFNMGESSDRWKPFTSDQLVVIRAPGFDWDARITFVPGMAVRVHDAYVAGEGILCAALLGLFPVADLRGTPEVAEGELMRFLAEAAWYPTALLPGMGVRWQEVDARSARATLADGPTSVTLLFSFGPDGLIETVRAAARGRTLGGRVVPTPWQGRFWNYERRGGMLVPLEGEVAWLPPEGPKPYWRGRIAAIEYEFAG